MADTKHYDIKMPELPEGADLEQYLNSVMNRIDCAMHEIELKGCSCLPDPLVKELTKMRCDIIAICSEVRRFGCVVRADQDAVSRMELDVKLISAKIDTVNKELADLSAQVSAMKVDSEQIAKNTEAISDLVADRDETNTKLNEVTETVDSLCTDMLNVKNTISTIQTENSSRDTTIAGLAQNLTTLNNTITSLSNIITAHEKWAMGMFDDAQGQIEALDTRLSDAEAEIIALQTAKADKQETAYSLQELEEKLDATAMDFDAKHELLQGDFDAFYDSVEGRFQTLLNIQIPNIQSTVGMLMAKVDALEGSSSDPAKLQQFAEKLNQLQSSINTVKSDVDTLTADLSDTNLDITDNIKFDITNLKTAVNSHNGIIQNLQTFRTQQGVVNSKVDTLYDSMYAVNGGYGVESKLKSVINDTIPSLERRLDSSDEQISTIQTVIDTLQYDVNQGIIDIQDIGTKVSEIEPLAKTVARTEYNLFRAGDALGQNKLARIRLFSNAGGNFEIYIGTAERINSSQFESSGVAYMTDFDDVEGNVIATSSNVIGLWPNNGKVEFTLPPNSTGSFIVIKAVGNYGGGV